MNVLLPAMFPEIVLIAVACALMLLGVSPRAGARRAAAWIALITLVALFIFQVVHEAPTQTLADPQGTVRVFAFAGYIKMLATGIGILLVLLAWPTNRDATGNSAMNFATESGEFFALMLLSLAGICLVASANDIILLFLGIELASIPTYIMVSISRPIPAAQEAGVKYFFLGAMAAALMLFGFSYLYGTTGSIRLDEIASMFRGQAINGVVAPHLTAWQTLAVVMLVAGFSFKIAAVPLHFYAGDVYQGAATPVTAFLSFVPKTTGMVALLKIVFVAGGGTWLAPDFLVKLLWILAVLTMFAGNVLGLLQWNIKRVFAYSSIAHTGYMLVGVTALASGQQQGALEGVLFYLAAYGIMNAAAFGVLMLLPARPARRMYDADATVPPATSAESFDDIAGQGRRYPALGLAMAVACFSLIGIPLTVGFFGKLLLIRPALESRLYWLVVFLVVNAAISAGYYLRIVGAMFLRPEPEGVSPPRAGELAGAAGNAMQPATAPPARLGMPTPIVVSVLLSVFATLLFGTLIPATQTLSNEVRAATEFDSSGPPPAGAPAPAAVTAAAAMRPAAAELAR
jgi:NADH-quinone oxidoreductase subunit N